MLKPKQMKIDLYDIVLFHFFIRCSNKVFCQLHTYSKRWYWQLNHDSKLTIVSLLCRTMALYTNNKTKQRN